MRKLWLVVLTLLAICGCGNQVVQTDVQTALVVDDKLQVVFNNLLMAASNSIATLPADQQPQARQLLADIQNKGLQGFQAKEDALQAALVANQPSVDVSALVAAIVAVTEDLWRLCSTWGVNGMLLAQTRVAIEGHKAAIVRGDYRGH